MGLRIRKRIEKVRWKYLISELLLIVIAINIGLWFNNLNDHRKARNLESKILQEFVVSLNSDKEDILSNITTHKKGIKSCVRLLKNKTEDIDSLKNDLGWSYSWTYLIADLSSYESLKSIGFQLIKNDEIRHGITKLYNVDYRTITEAENNHKRICNLFDEKMNDIYRVENSKAVFKESNSTTINNLKIGLINLQNSHKSMKNTYEIEVLPKIDDLISKINKELH
jgi:ABC-type antimicrobial peptide transport system permease subunit